MDRRSFISNFGIFSGGLALACTSLSRRALAVGGPAPLAAQGFGELFPTAAKNTGEVYLALPKGFEYNVIGKIGETLSDGRPTPARHDGMWTFKVKGELRIVRNHEVINRNLPVDGAGIGTGNHYDETAGGGTTTLVINPRTRTITRQFISLSGTHVNCAGGPTPWGSWISCEESTLGRTVRTSPAGVKTGGFLKPHGYCFEVPASANSTVNPVPLRAMGRFVHEAVAVGKGDIVYLTEDANPCGFYRFLPKRRKRLLEGGMLQMLSIKDRPRYDTRTKQKQGQVLEAEWVTIDNPDPAEADVDNLAVYKQGLAKGGATFNRLEGCCTDDKGNIYFTSTSGGDARGGQIWRYDPAGRDGGRLTLVFESPGQAVLNMPDNICLMPDSDLLFICEDSDYVGQESKNHVRILTPEGKMADFARNAYAKMPRSEFAGSTFSPDGKILFVNLQTAGATFAIWGDWDSFKR